MLLSAVSVLVVAQSSSEIPEGLMNNTVLVINVLYAVLIMHNMWEHMISCSLFCGHCAQNVSDENQFYVCLTLYILSKYQSNYIKELPVFSASVSISDFHSLNVFLFCDSQQDGMAFIIIYRQCKRTVFVYHRRAPLPVKPFYSFYPQMCP